eukprot:5409482-Prymnesium_polylepis.1
MAQRAGSRARHNSLGADGCLGTHRLIMRWRAAHMPSAITSSIACTSPSSPSLARSPWTST